MTEDSDYWKRRAEALEAALETLRRRMLTLAEVLPLESLRYLQEDAAPQSTGSAAEVLEGWDDDTRLLASDVETELRLLWERMGR